MSDFEWDDEKNASNLQKHGIRFEEAVSIFDGLVLTGEDIGLQGESRSAASGC